MILRFQEGIFVTTSLKKAKRGQYLAPNILKLIQYYSAVEFYFNTIEGRAYLRRIRQTLSLSILYLFGKIYGKLDWELFLHYLGSIRQTWRLP